MTFAEAPNNQLPRNIGTFRVWRVDTWSASQEHSRNSQRKTKIMELPAQTKPAAWGAVGGAVALAIIGFNWGGWQTTASANKMAKEQSDQKVIAALAPFCVDRFLKSADATQSAELLKLTTNYDRGSFLEKGGYTSLPGSTETNWGVGRACGDLLAAAAKK